MKKPLFSLFVLSLLSVAQAKPIEVLTSFSILQDVTQELGGERVKVNTLIGRNEDAHVYQLKQSDMQKIQTAKLIVLNGLGFERADIRRATHQSGKPIAHAAQGLKARPISAHTHAQGQHEHGAFDPHVWHDPILMQQYAGNITQALIQADPQGKSHYQQRLTQYQHKLQQLHQWNQSQFQGIHASKRKVLTAHESFAYLGQRYGIEFYAPQSISTHHSASAATVAQLIKQIKQQQIRAIFIENMVNPKLVQQIAKETGLKPQGTLYADALSQASPANTYWGLMRHNVGALSQAMR